MPTDKFFEEFDLKEELGRGSFSIVYRIVEKKTKKQYAAKMIKKKKLTKRDFMNLEREARICKKLNHPHIVKLYYVINEPDYHFFLFDLMTGGELLDDIIENEIYTEELTAKCMLQILESIQYCHNNDVVHRDLKPDNILLYSKERKVIKIADFGLAIETEQNGWYGMAGTSSYMAPEMLSMEPYGKEIDMWACGVIMYILLAGYQPFYHSNKRLMTHMIKTADYDITYGLWDEVTEEGKDLITKMLCVMPSKRITAYQALLHPWFTTVRTSLKIHRQSTLEKLKEFQAKRSLKSSIRSNVLVQSFLKPKVQLKKVKSRALSIIRSSKSGFTRSSKSTNKSSKRM